MKLITAVIKPHKWEDVREALETFGVTGMTVSEVSGYGRQKDKLEQYTGGEFGAVYLPKIEIRFVCRDDLVETIVQRIIAAARTGRIGDGKILVLSVMGSVEF